MKEKGITGFALVFLLLSSCTDVVERNKSYGDGNDSYLLPIEDKKKFSENQVKLLKDLGYELIRAGEFKMGSPFHEPGRPPVKNTNDEDPLNDEDEERLTTVRLSNDYFIGKFEVSNAEWALIWKSNVEKLSSPTEPVTQVSHTRAMAYCRELTRLMQIMEILPENTICRLPTEAEWEYACRAGNDGVHGFMMSEGDQSEFKNVFNADDANFARSSGSSGQTKLYGSDLSSYSFKDFSKNKWDLYHMHGNVREWCYDLYGVQYENPFSREVSIDPIGRLEGKYRVLRGGSFRTYWTKCRSAARDFAEPYTMKDDIGFRVVIGHPIR
jgi:formylglycine-generating enzyme required for sulfatase activity